MKKAWWLLLPFLALGGWKLLQLRRVQGQQCQQNLARVANAMNWYAVDNDGLPAQQVTRLVPIYLASPPNCGSHSYRVETQARRYTLICPHHGPSK